MAVVSYGGKRLERARCAGQGPARAARLSSALSDGLRGAAAIAFVSLAVPVLLVAAAASAQAPKAPVVPDDMGWLMPGHEVPAVLPVLTPEGLKFVAASDALTAAEECARAADQLGPVMEGVKARALAAALYAGAGRSEDALRHYDTFLADYPLAVEEFQARERVGQYAKNRRVLDQGLVLSRAMRRAAEVADELGRPDTSLGLCDGIVRRHPELLDSKWGALNAAEHYLSIRDYQRAGMAWLYSCAFVACERSMPRSRRMPT